MTVSSDDITNLQVYRFPLREVLPTIADAADYLHLTDEVEHPGYLFMVDKIRELAASTREAVGGYRLFTVEKLAIPQGNIHLAGTTLHLDRQVAGYMRDAEQVALFICTAGEVFTQQYRRYTNTGDYLEAYITDAIGSLTVERAMDRIQALLREDMANRNLHISTRYSPGYCNWPLTEQQTLFGLLGENSIGISLSDSCLMYPTKSVSGIIGIGENVKARAYGCPTCNNQNCIYRRILKE